MGFRPKPGSAFFSPTLHFRLVIQPEVAEFFRNYSEKHDIDPESINPILIERTEDDVYDEMIEAVRRTNPDWKDPDDE